MFSSSYFKFLLILSSIVACSTHDVSHGTLEHFKKFNSEFVRSRDIGVWLPKGYNPEKRYAVLYMQDGKSLFDANLTWNHQEWGVDEVLSELMGKTKIRNCIVVGIENGNALRHSEYMPQKPFEGLAVTQQDLLYRATRKDNSHFFTDKIQSDNYLKFLVYELKPFIDLNYSTIKDSQNTFIAGSSMGGLIALYAVCEYPDVFGGAACLSTHWTGIYTLENNPIPAALMEYLKVKIPPPENHKIYFDYGSLTLDTLYKPFQMQVDAIMLSKGYDNKGWLTKEFIGADHSEQAWSKRLSIPMEFLLKEN